MFTSVQLYMSFRIMCFALCKQGSSTSEKCKMLPLLYSNIAVNSTAYESVNEKGNLSFVGSRTECNVFIRSILT